jgi:hypothetical protein
MLRVVNVHDSEMTRRAKPGVVGMRNECGPGTRTHTTHTQIHGYHDVLCSLSLSFVVVLNDDTAASNTKYQKYLR